MRSPKRLAEIRKLPCVRCGNPNSQAAHSNSSRDGKGRGIKASDAFVIPYVQPAMLHSIVLNLVIGQKVKQCLISGW